MCVYIYIYILYEDAKYFNIQLIKHISKNSQADLQPNVLLYFTLTSNQSPQIIPGHFGGIFLAVGYLF